MTRSNTPGAATGAGNSNKDYSLSADPSDALGVDSLDDDLGSDALASAGLQSRVPTVASPVADETPRSVVVPDELAGERLDKVHRATCFPSFHATDCRAGSSAERVRMDGKPAKIRQPVPLGATIELVPDLLPEQLAFTPEPVPLEIVYEDDTLVVINKPAGMVVHPAAGNWSGTVLNGLLYRYGDAAAGLPRAGIVHRLDKETSGLMVVARTLEAQTDLVRQLQARTVKRRYLALVWGNMPEEGTIDAPIGRDPRERTRMAVVTSASGKAARTHFRRCGYGDLAASAGHRDSLRSGNRPHPSDSRALRAYRPSAAWRSGLWAGTRQALGDAAAGRFRASGAACMAARPDPSANRPDHAVARRCTGRHAGAVGGARPWA